MQQLAGCYLMMYQPLWILMQQTGTICNRLELFEQFSKKEHVQFIPAKFGKNLARNLDVLWSNCKPTAVSNNHKSSLWANDLDERKGA